LADTLWGKLLLLFIILFSFSSGSFIYLLEKDWVDFSTFEVYKTARPSIVYDSDGEEITRFELDKRDQVTFDQLPKNLIDAFVAAEDHGFFSHYGISLKGIIRSFFKNVYHGRVVQGASTITQQVAKLMFLTYDRNLYRKIQEMFLAFQLERQLSKQQILQLYVNHIYFGRGVYGVEAACQRFWNKSLSELTVADAATLAAVAKSARFYSPLNNLANAKHRRNVILRSMRQRGSISQGEFDQAITSELIIEDFSPANPIRQYLVEWIRIWAENKWGKDLLYRGGMRIKTTINLDTQEKAEQAFARQLQKLRKTIGDQLNGGMMSIESSTGHIKAMIGGYDFKQSQFNRATQAQRQMGSSFKPFLYALALKSGIPADTVFIDQPLEVEMDNGSVWKPKNWHYRYDGSMTLARALRLSNNIIAAQLFLKLGSKAVADWVPNFGFELQNFYPANALGTCEVSVEQNVAAFNVFANNGVYIQPSLIKWVKNSAGKKIWHASHKKKRALDARLNSQMVNLLSHRMRLAKEKTGSDQWINCESIGKTGGTNGAVTSWFVGATPELTTAIYLGRDDGKPVGKWVFASTMVFPIWLEFYRSLDLTKKHFYIDPHLSEYKLNWVTGEPATVFDEPADVATILV